MSLFDMSNLLKYIMLVAMKMPLTKKTQKKSLTQPFLYVKSGRNLYAIPKKVIQRYLLKSSIQFTGKPEDETLSVQEVFGEYEKKFTKAGILLKGLRCRENMTQTEFAKKIHVSQANLSKMETGKRPIGKQIAKRIEECFHVNYRYFLE